MRNPIGSDEGGSTSGHKHSRSSILSKKKSILKPTPSMASSIDKKAGQSSKKLEPGVVGCPVLACQLSSGSSFISDEELFSPRTVTPPPAEPSAVFPFQFNTRIRLLVLNVVNGVVLSGTLEGLTNSLIDSGERTSTFYSFIYSDDIWHSRAPRFFRYFLYGLHRFHNT